MDKPHKEMSIQRLRAVTNSYEKLIEKHRQDKPKTSKRYEVKLRDAQKWLDIKTSQAEEIGAKENKALDADYTKRFKALLGKVYDRNTFEPFVIDFRRHLQNKI